MKQDMKNIINHVIAVLVFILFCYAATVLNLYKLTKVLEFNILKSDGLEEYLFLIGIFLPLIIIFLFIKNRFDGKKKG